MPAESLRALSVRLPWAALIAHGYKSIEVRSWPTDFRGALAICSSRRWDESEEATYQWAKYYPMSEGETGCVVCLVDLVNVRPLTNKDARAACATRFETVDGLYAWVLKSPKPLRPAPVTGRLGLFEIPGSKAIPV